MDAKVLEILGLEKKYDSGFHLEISELCLNQNEILAIIGPNGSGKSTLLKLIGLLEKSGKGKIFFYGKNISNGPVDQIKTRREMAVVLQESILFNTSVYNNILMGLKIRNIKVSNVKEHLDFLVDRLKIGKLLNRNIKDLSGGEKQRVSLVRAFVLDPKLLLLDEPLANIDESSKEELRKDLFKLLKHSGKSTIYVTHDRSEAMALADNIAILNEGRIEQIGEKKEVFKKPVNEFTAKFVGIETLLSGVVNECSGSLCTVKIGNNVGRVFVLDKAEVGSKVLLAIRPEAVILYNIELKPKDSSAMNLYKGTVTEIQDIGLFKKVGINCGFDLISFVTQNSLDRLNITVGKKIFAGFKASSIHMFKN